MSEDVEATDGVRLSDSAFAVVRRSAQVEDGVVFSDSSPTVYDGRAIIQMFTRKPAIVIEARAPSAVAVTRRPEIEIGERP